jgi:hypothetical protein
MVSIHHQKTHRCRLYRSRAPIRHAHRLGGAIFAFLIEKRGRSGSTRTVESYARMLWPSFRVKIPDQVR